MSLTKKILIGMALGLAFGVLFQVTDLVTNDFINGYVINGVIDAGGKIFVVAKNDGCALGLCIIGLWCEEPWSNR